MNDELTKGVVYEKENFTKEEVKYFQDQFLDHIVNMIDYVENESRSETTKDKLELLAFTILSCIDGCSGDCGGFMLVPIPESHFEDPEYELPDNISNFDIAGELHSMLVNKQ